MKKKIPQEATLDLEQCKIFRKVQPNTKREQTKKKTKKKLKNK